MHQVDTRSWSWSGACSFLTARNSVIRAAILDRDAAELCVKSREGAARSGALLSWLVQLHLKIPDVVDDMLKDLHLAGLLVGRQRGHQLLELAVAAVHVLQKDAHVLIQQRQLALGDAQALIRQTAHYLVSADLALQSASLRRSHRLGHREEAHYNRNESFHSEVIMPMLYSL